jgi:hypothetical protein
MKYSMRASFGQDLFGGVGIAGRGAAAGATGGTTGLAVAGLAGAALTVSVGCAGIASSPVTACTVSALLSCVVKLFTPPASNASL